MADYARVDLRAQVVLHPALEMAGSHYASTVDDRNLTTYDAIAKNGSGGAFVCGTVVADWHPLDLATLSIDARTGSGTPSRVYIRECRLDSGGILVETVNGLSERRIAFVRSNILSTGSLTLPTPLLAGQVCVARIAGRPPIGACVDAR